jgi:hypothetical protein
LPKLPELVSFDASMAEAEHAAANFDRIAIDEGGLTIKSFAGDGDGTQIAG